MSVNIRWAQGTEEHKPATFKPYCSTEKLDDLLEQPSIQQTDRTYVMTVTAVGKCNSTVTFHLKLYTFFFWFGTISIIVCFSIFPGVAEENLYTETQQTL